MSSGLQILFLEQSQVIISIVRITNMCYQILCSSLLWSKLIVNDMEERLSQQGL